MIKNFSRLREINVFNFLFYGSVTGLYMERILERDREMCCDCVREGVRDRNRHLNRFTNHFSCSYLSTQASCDSLSYTKRKLISRQTVWMRRIVDKRSISFREETDKNFFEKSQPFTRPCMMSWGFISIIRGSSSESTTYMKFPESFIYTNALMIKCLLHSERSFIRDVRIEL